ncbi:MAG: hypothetical protein LBI72_03780 [Flavobacteriaceae bacterium]|jgi:hypothetical protein|nr:hypothetical protein [Flavobacteriaceae bacterium]
MRTYLSLTDVAQQGIGEYLYYECIKCDVVVYSYPVYRDSCACGNIAVDAITSSVCIKDKDSCKVFEDRGE